MASNENYVRYDAEGNPVVPQPGSTQDTSDPGLGWQTTPYKNFNADYVARDADDNPRTPLPYIPHGEGNQIVPKDTYVRMDADCNPVVSPGPLVPAPAGQIFAPDGLVVGRVIYAVARSLLVELHQLHMRHSFKERLPLEYGKVSLLG